MKMDDLGGFPIFFPYFWRATHMVVHPIIYGPGFSTIPTSRLHLRGEAPAMGGPGLGVGMMKGCW